MQLNLYFTAYLDERDVNLIAVDWGDVAIDINYVFVSSQVTVIGKAVAEFLEKLSRVIDLNTLHVIGHSLGAHVAGQIGRSMNVTLTRITGELLRKTLQERIKNRVHLLNVDR